LQKEDIKCSGFEVKCVKKLHAYVSTMRHLEDEHHVNIPTLLDNIYIDTDTPFRIVLILNWLSCC